ncbi:acetoacetyl-CoA synthetase-like isoform X2 [Stegodyphus dumicola]|uniref:acetoacetyl-CoA synthetase-like isoform X2 n=1 Tax=Stegodyphus dumicola TaxID=202533 RepID=UPI0015B1C5AC|nr:acetoacetyl-CoA synthetase-like isoform X2 [Stegodyphus dumicola]
MDKTDNIPEVVWQPREDSGAEMRKFKKLIESKYNVTLKDFWDLHKWSVEHLQLFWAEMWKQCDIIYSKNFDQVVDLNIPMEDSPAWFEGARLNFAENILKFRDDHMALICAGEDRETMFTTYAEMYEEATLYTAALRKFGLKKGDIVACYMSNRKEAIMSMLGATSIGAIFTGALPILGSKGVLNCFKLVNPKVLFTIDRYRNNNEEVEMLTKVKEIAEGLPSLEKVIIVPSKKCSKLKDISKIKNSCFLDEFLELGREADGTVAPLIFEQVSFSHPVFIIYTSGTTGPPKALYAGSGILLSTARDCGMYGNLDRDTVWLSFSAVGWVSWCMITALHFLGYTVILFESNPYLLSPTFLWDLVDDLKITHLFISPGILDDLERKGYLPTEKHNLSSLKAIMSGGSVVKPQNFEFHKKVKKDVLYHALYGSTEVMMTVMWHDHSLPVYKGELSSPCLGVDIQCLNEEGKFAMSDIGIINPKTKGLIICGRSDATLNVQGWRIGTTQIYSIVDKFPEVQDSVCVSQYGKNLDERAVLFLKMKEGCTFNDELVRRIQDRIGTELLSYYIPDVILETMDIPYTASGKELEIIVKKIINNMPYNPETVINPECLPNFYNIPELQGF